MTLAARIARLEQRHAAIRMDWLQILRTDPRRWLREVGFGKNPAAVDKATEAYGSVVFLLAAEAANKPWLGIDGAALLYDLGARGPWPDSLDQLRPLCASDDERQAFDQIMAAVEGGENRHQAALCLAWDAHM